MGIWRIPNFRTTHTTLFIIHCPMSLLYYPLGSVAHVPVDQAASAASHPERPKFLPTQILWSVSIGTVQKQSKTYCTLAAKSQACSNACHQKMLLHRSTISCPLQDENRPVAASATVVPWPVGNGT